MLIGNKKKKKHTFPFFQVPKIYQFCAYFKHFLCIFACIQQAYYVAYNTVSYNLTFNWLHNYKKCNVPCVMFHNYKKNSLTDNA